MAMACPSPEMVEAALQADDRLARRLGLIVQFQMVAYPAAWLDDVLAERLCRQYREELVPLVG